MNETYTVTTKEYTFDGVTRYTKETLSDLVARVKLGNEKLGKVYDQMKEITPNTERWSSAMEQWHRANVLLKIYCDQLEWLGFLDCLYIENGVKTRKCLDGLGCRVCPSKKPYWEDELMELPSAGGDNG